MERDLDKFLDELEDMIFFLDMDGKIVNINKSVLTKLGYSFEELEDKHVNIVHPPERCDEVELVMRKILSGEENKCTIPLIDKKGNLIFAETKIFTGRWKEKDVIIGLCKDLSEYVRIEHSVLESKAQLQSILDNMPFMAWIKDSKGIFKAVNRPFERYYGLERNEILGKTDFDICKREEALIYKADDDQIIESRCQKNSEVKINGNWYETIKKPVFDENGKIIGITGISRNITQRKNMEIEIIKNKKFLKNIMDVIPDIIFYKDVNSIYLGCNKAFAETILGKDESEIVGKTDYDLIEDKKLVEYVREKDIEAMGIGRPRINEETLMTYDKNNVDLEMIKTPFYDEKNELMGVIGIGRDITDRKKFEKELNKKEKMLLASSEAIKSLLDNRDYMFALEKSFDVLGLALEVDKIHLFLNTYSRGKRGKTSLKAQWEDGDFSTDIPRDKFQKIPFEKISSIIEPLKNGTIFSSDISYIRDPRVRSFLSAQGILSAVIMPLFVKEIFWGFILFENCKCKRTWIPAEVSIISAFSNSLEKAIERNLVEQELEDSKNKLEATKNLKTRFLANMAHEIRTPMNSIIGFLELIKKTELSTLQKEFIDEAREASDILLYLINDILDISRIEAGKLSMEKIEFDLKKLANESINLIYYKAKERGIELNLEVGDGVPDSVIGDPSRLRQVLNNLLGNALKFTEKGEIKMTLNILRRGEKESEFKFEIIDTGIGIVEKNLKQLFTPFSQGDASTTRKYGGTGLGLAISKEIVELMGGKIGAKNNNGNGTIFFFTIKLGIGENKKILEIEKENTNLKRHVKKDRLDILLVEDNDINIKVANYLLGSLGLDCDIAKNGVEAIEYLKEKEYDIVFMDCQMPIMDGYDATRNIRKMEKSGKHTTIVAMTANAMEGDREKCLEAGMDDYMSKPLDIEMIKGIIEKYS